MTPPVPCIADVISPVLFRLSFSTRLNFKTPPYLLTMQGFATQCAYCHHNNPFARAICEQCDRALIFARNRPTRRAYSPHNLMNQVLAGAAATAECKACIGGLSDGHQCHLVDDTLTDPVPDAVRWGRLGAKRKRTIRPVPPCFQRYLNPPGGPPVPALVPMVEPDEQQAPPQPRPALYHCPQCTFEQEFLALRCELCYTKFW